MKPNKAYTLSELLIVVSIITILVGICIPVFATKYEKTKLMVDKANIRACYADACQDYISNDWDGTTKQFQEGNMICNGTVVNTVVTITVVSGAKSKTIQDASNVYFEAGTFYIDGVANVD